MTYTQFQQPPSAPYQHASYVSAHNRARLVTILLIAGAVISLLTIPSHVLDMYVPPINEDQELSDNPMGFLALALTGVLGLATIAVYIATVIVFLMWLHRVAKNVAAFGEPLQHSPGWAVGSFFVPIMNLFVPYQAVRDVWKKSDPDAIDSRFYTVAEPGFFAAWWGFWIASNITSNIYFRLSMMDTVPVSVGALGFVGIISEILSIAAAGFAVQVVKAIDRRQEERARMQQKDFHAPPPPPVFENREPAQAPPENTTAAGIPPAPTETSSLSTPTDTSGLAEPPTRRILRVS